MKNLEKLMKARSDATALIKSLADLSPSLANWTYHPADQNTIVDLETKDTLVGYTMSIQDTKFILWFYHNYKLVVRTLQTLELEIDDALIDADDFRARVISAETELGKLRESEKKMRGCLGGIISNDLLIQGECIKLAETLLNEEVA
jgi:hypothetical protein